MGINFISWGLGLEFGLGRRAFGFGFWILGYSLGFRA